MGYSNGGYVLNHWYRTGCAHHQKNVTGPSWLLAVGSLGGNPDEIVDPPSSWNCPPTQFAIGNDDRENYKPQVLNRLTQLNGPMKDPIFFQGEHELEPAVLENAIREMIAAEQ
jgi:hypothetical protein